MDANWAIVILTIALVLATGYYAWHTRKLALDTKRMADIMAADYEQRIRPLLQIDWHSHDVSEAEVMLTNKGQNSLELKRVTLVWVFRADIQHQFEIEQNHLNMLGILYPEESKPITLQYSREEFAEKDRTKYNTRETVDRILNDIQACARVYFFTPSKKEEYKDSRAVNLS
jgi:hypothetical protein